MLCGRPPGASSRGNFSPVRDDLNGVTCERWIEAISAMVDGEDPGVDRRLLDAHLARCGSCRNYRDGVVATRGPLRVGIADRIPDLSRRIVKLNALMDRSGRWAAARIVLGVVAVEIIVLSIPSLILSDPSKTVVHAGRHLGSFSIAYAVGLLVVVARPARARTMLPVAQVLAATLLLTGVVDVANRAVPLVGEVTHIPELFSVLLLWLLAVPSPRVRGASDHGETAKNSLRLATDTEIADERDRAM